MVGINLKLGVLLAFAGVAMYFVDNSTAKTFDASPQNYTPDNTPAGDYYGDVSDVYVPAAAANVTYKQAISDPSKMPYVYALRISENENGIPYGLLVAMCYNESRINPAIGKSPKGAVGIMQFMPATAAALGIDPYQPGESIQAAGKYLRYLYDKFGSWKSAVAAYNWGEGNVMRYGVESAPLETRTYLNQAFNNSGVAYA